MRDNLMSSRNLFASIVMACLLVVGALAIAPVANATPAGLSVLKRGESAGNYVIEIKRRSRGPRRYLPRGPRFYLPIVPYVAYDYPYYYSRGFYPTHIGPGYVYYGYPYYYYSRRYYRDPGPRRRHKARRH